MPAQHWIITNREIATQRQARGRVEVVVDGRRHPLPVFRIARFVPPAQAEPSDDALKAAVEIIPDEFVDSYKDIDPKADAATMRGTRQLFKGLYDQMLGAPHDKGDTLFFIHGFNYTWASALRHLHRLHAVYAVPKKSPVSQIVYFSWPSWGESGRYLSDQQIAQPSGYLLGRVFDKAVQFYREFFGRSQGAPEFCGKNLHIAAHSMGNQVLQEFVRAINDFGFLKSCIFSEALLLNADADWDALERPTPERPRPLFSLPDYARRVHVYNHTSDDALAISETTKNDRRRLGLSGPRDWREICPRTLIVDCSSAGANSGSSSGRRPVDNAWLAAATEVLGSAEVSVRERMFDHWGYLHRREVIADIYQVLRGVSSSSIKDRDHREGPRYVLK